MGIETLAVAAGWDPFIDWGLGPVLAWLMPAIIVATMVYIEVLRRRDKRRQ